MLLKISAGVPGLACKSTRFCSQPPEMGQLLVRAPLCHLYQALPYAAQGEWTGTGRLKAGFTLKLFSRYENHREPDPISLLLWAISGENVGFLYFPTHFCSTDIAFWSLNTQHHPGWLLPQQDMPCSPCLRARGMRVLCRNIISEGDAGARPQIQATGG